jgi:hypothetical protein
VKKAKSIKSAEVPIVDDWSHWTSTTAAYIKLGLSKFDLDALGVLAKAMPAYNGPRVAYVAWSTLRIALAFYSELGTHFVAARRRCEAEDIRLDDYLSRRIVEQFDLSLNHIDGRSAGFLSERQRFKARVPIADPDASLDDELRDRAGCLNGMERRELALRFKRWARQLEKTLPAVERMEREGKTIQGKTDPELKPRLN